MKRVEIRLCGAGLVGKSEILTQIGRLTGAGQPSWHGDMDRYVSLTVLHDGAELHFKGSAGAVFYQDDVYRGLLEGADAVLYVISAASAHHAQVETFQKYVCLAQELGKTWETIPWWVVRNKIDHGSGNPLEAHLPPPLRARVFSTQARAGTGIEELWTSIVEKLGGA